MKNAKGLIVLLLLTCGLNAESQVYLHADNSSGCGNLEATFTVMPPGAADTISDISWDFGNGTTLSGNISPTVTYDEPGIYHVSALINNTTLVTDSGEVVLYPFPVASFFYTDSLDAGEYALIFRCDDPSADSIAYNYEWTFEDGSVAAGRSVFHDFGSEGNYLVRLRVSGSESCADSSFKRIQVNSILKVPNIFTPNGDGLNDYFQIRTNGQDTYSFAVYTRSGVLVYKSESPTITWDGRSFTGEEVRNGIYFFTISQVTGENRIQTKGFVHLIR
jgi:gliding motility-associated-like protein